MTASFVRDTTSTRGVDRERLRTLAVNRFERSADLATQFVHSHASLMARACMEMADRFQRGGRLLAFGIDAAATDARHVTVEFVHPVIVGKVALPALTLSSRDDGNAPFVRELSLLGNGSDIAMGIAGDDGSRLRPALGVAQAAGMLTLAFVGQAPDASHASFVFSVADEDSLVVQEVHEHVYHVLWELVHVFLETPQAS